MAGKKPIPTEAEYDAFWEHRPTVSNSKGRKPEETLFDVLVQGAELLKNSPKENEALDAIKSFTKEG